MSLPGGCGCEPEEIFELADRSLTPEREQKLRDHMELCPECHELYQREKRLNICLKSISFSGSRSVREGVAMALPTRPLKARLLWASMAAIMLGTALFALGLNGINPVAYLVDAMTVFWTSASMLADVVGTVLAIAGGALLVVLVVGAVLDLVLAAVFMSVLRRRTRQV
ncbi:hypothetical protein BH23ACT11_BH23ACT11_14280 [soil metagenome]